jgi:4-amino-4-deoxy-L-arabinose transferase-like glycosyltransferase
MSSPALAPQRPAADAAPHRSGPGRSFWQRFGVLVTNPWFIAGMAFAARLAYMLVLKTWHIRADQNHFAFGYETGSIARSIAEGKGFASPFRNVDTGPTAWIAPIYPYFCALVFKLFGVFTPLSAVVILGVNSLFSAATVLPLHRIAARTFNRSTATLAAWMWALVPYFMCWPAAWVWEAGVSACLVCLIISVAYDLPQAATRRWLLFGLIGGAAVLTNPALLTLLPIAALWAVRKADVRAIAFRRALLAGLVCVAVLSPWLVRNRVVMGKWVFIRDNFAFEFSLGNYPGGSGMGWAGLHPAINDRVMKEYSQKGELTFLAARTDFPKTYVTQHTSEFAQQTLHRFTAFWDGTSLYWNRFAEDVWQPLPFFTLTVLAALGCALAIGTRVLGALMTALCCVLYPWPYYITYPQTRYRHAIEPLLVMFMAHFLVALVDRAKERWKSVRKDAIAN